MEWEKRTCITCGSPVLALHVPGGYKYKREDPIHYKGGCYCFECIHGKKVSGSTCVDGSQIFLCEKRDGIMRENDFCSLGKRSDDFNA